MFEDTVVCYGGIVATYKRTTRNDAIVSASGNDMVYATAATLNAGDIIDVGAETDALILALSAGAAVTFNVADLLTQQTLSDGGSFANVEQFGITGSVFADRLDGGDGNDSLRGRFRNDQLDGGTGTDWPDYSDKAETVVATLLGSANAS